MQLMNRDDDSYQKSDEMRRSGIRTEHFAQAAAEQVTLRAEAADALQVAPSNRRALMAHDEDAYENSYAVDDSW